MKRLKTVFITGAGGFIGGRVAESLYLKKLADVRAGVHRWTTAARIARFPIKTVQCNILDSKMLPHLLNGCEAIVHCAYGDERVNKEGTRNLLNAAMEVGIKRFIHISTIAVYGKASGEIDETVPMRYCGEEYADSKLDAEKLCLEYKAKGLPIVILRPTIVYGPFSPIWTVLMAQRFLSGGWKIPAQAGGFCQPVYIDDVVSAIILALEAEQATGEAFNIAGQEILTWDEFLEKFNAAMNLPPIARQNAFFALMQALLMAPMRSAAQYIMIRYPELVKELLNRLKLDKFGKMAQSSIRMTPTLTELKLYERKAIYKIDKARKVLGFLPSVELVQGLKLTVQWLKHHGYLRA